MKKISVPYIDQTVRYPTGCESVSAVMLLRYLGYDISVETFIDGFLPKGDLVCRDGQLFGPHPDDRFIGSPYTDDSGSYGCYAPCIAAALEQIAGDRFRVIVERGRSIPYLLETYIDRDMPVVFWATLNMEPSRPGPVWHLTERDGTFQWTSHQHCLLLVGYDAERYYFIDPWHKLGCSGFERVLSEMRDRELGEQAVGLIPKA